MCGCVWQEAESRRIDHAESTGIVASRAVGTAVDSSEQTAGDLRQNIAVPMAYNYV